MQQSMVNDVVEVKLAERRREAALQRRIASARRAGRIRQGVPAWRVRVGGWLIAADSAIHGSVARGTVSARFGDRRFRVAQDRVCGTGGDC